MAKTKQKPEKSGALSTIFLALSLVAVAAIVGGIVHAHLRDKERKANTYYGDPADFESPACVVYQRLIEATPEYQELTRLLEENGIDRNDPKASDLTVAAADRVAGAIAKFAEENACDLVCELEYWKKFATSGETAGDVTDSVVDIIRGQ